MLADKVAAGTLPAGAKTAADVARMVFNDRLDAAVAGFFMVSVVIILLDSLWVWYGIVSGARAATSSEVPFTARAVQAS